MCNNTSESLPPDTATQTSSSFFIMLYFEIVFAVFLKIECEKHSEQKFSPEYFLEYTAIFSHLSHFILII